MVLTYQNLEDAIQACYTLKESTHEERSLSGKNIFEFLIAGTHLKRDI